MSWVKELWVLLYMGVAGVYWTLIEINILERLPRWWRGEPQEEVPSRLYPRLTLTPTGAPTPTSHVALWSS